MRNRLEWVQNADWRCIALPGSLPLSGPVCLDVLLRALLVQKLGHCQFIKAASDTAMQPSPCAHTLCSSCLHHLPRRSLSSYSTSLSPSTDHLSITRPRLLICPPQCLVTGLHPPTAATLSFTCHRAPAVRMSPD